MPSLGVTQTLGGRKQVTLGLLSWVETIGNCFKVGFAAISGTADPGALIGRMLTGQCDAMRWEKTVPLVQVCL